MRMRNKLGGWWLQRVFAIWPCFFIFPLGDYWGQLLIWKTRGYLSSASGGNERSSFRGVGTSWRVAFYSSDSRKWNNVSQRLESFMTSPRTHFLYSSALITFAKRCNSHLASCFLPQNRRKTKQQQHQKKNKKTADYPHGVWGVIPKWKPVAMVTGSRCKCSPGSQRGAAGVGGKRVSVRAERQSQSSCCVSWEKQRSDSGVVLHSLYCANVNYWQCQHCHTVGEKAWLVCVCVSKIKKERVLWDMWQQIVCFAFIRRWRGGEKSHQSKRFGCEDVVDT